MNKLSINIFDLPIKPAILCPINKFINFKDILRLIIICLKILLKNQQILQIIREMWKNRSIYTETLLTILIRYTHWSYTKYLLGYKYRL
jgi:hypothetical protein